MKPNALENPIWRALTGAHAGIAEGSDLARRYPPDVAQFCAIREPSPDAFESLARLLGPAGIAVFFTSEIQSWPGGWTQVFTGPVLQMVCEALPEAPELPARELRLADAKAMLELVQLTQPGPFKERTVELGRYLGIDEASRLVAMAGERLRWNGFTEVSAVCTHPDYRGRGYARGLVHRLSTDILARDEIPFLHVFKDNLNAIRVYETLGFRVWREVRVLVLRAPS